MQVLGPELAVAEEEAEAEVHMLSLVLGKMVAAAAAPHNKGSEAAPEAAPARPSQSTLLGVDHMGTVGKSKDADHSCTGAGVAEHNMVVGGDILPVVLMLGKARHSVAPEYKTRDVRLGCHNLLSFGSMGLPRLLERPPP